MKKNNLLIFIIALLFALPVYAGQLAPQGPFRAFDDNGVPCVGCKLYTYEAGTTTNKTTYTTFSEATANANPVVLNSDGYGNIWLGDGSYKFVLKDPNDATLWTLDDISGTRANAFGDEVVYLSTNTTITSAYENQLIVATASPTLSLLSAAQAGEGFTFAVSTQSGSTTVDADGAETINGSATVTIEAGEGAIFFSDGSNWITLLQQTVKLTQDNTFTAVNTFSNSVVFNGKIRAPNDGTLTIATGIITPTGIFHDIDTQSAAATDDLDTAAGIESGQILFMRANNSARDVVIKHNTGNFFVPNALDITLDTNQRIVGSIYDATLAKNIILFDGTTKEYVDSQATTAKIYSGTMQATTSGSSKDFSIPSGVKNITMLLSGVSTNGSNMLLTQIGTAATPETTSYLGVTQSDGTTGANYSTGFQACVSVGAGNIFHATINLSLVDSATNLWSFSTLCAKSDSTSGGAQYGAGSRALSGVLDIIRLSTADTFDAGNINIQYEY